jgi:hypothetical protein
MWPVSTPFASRFCSVSLQFDDLGLNLLDLSLRLHR